MTIEQLKATAHIRTERQSGLSRREVVRQGAIAGLVAGLAADGAIGRARAEESASPVASPVGGVGPAPGVPGVTHRTVTSNGIDVHIAEAGEGPLVLLVHGYPELWFSWRHQIVALAEAGYHVVAPDQVGIGGTEAPEAVARYSVLRLVEDAIGVLDALEVEQAALVGHDWGAEVAWRCAQLHPERVPAVAALSVPFYQRAPEPPTDIQPQVVGFFRDYVGGLGGTRSEEAAEVRTAIARMLYALSGDAPPGALEAVFAGQAAANADGLRSIRLPETLPSWLADEDLDYYASEFARTGFEGVINRYRNLVRDWEELAVTEGMGVEQAALFVGGERDSAVVYGSLEPMEAAVPNLRDAIILPGCGHWVQQERADEVNSRLIAFLRAEYPEAG